MSAYVVTSSVTLTATFTNIAGIPANPTTVVLTVKSPSGVTSTPSVTNTSTGVYTATFSLTAPGRWSYEWQATGAIEVATDGVIDVRSSRVDAT